MTGILHLDMSAQNDDGLLVPFGSAKDAAPSENHNPLFAPPPVYRPRGGFFRRRQQQQKKPEPEEEEDPTNVKKTQVTFGFPKAPQAFADEEETDDPFKDNPVSESPKNQKAPKKEEDESSDESSSSSSEDESDAKTENDRENQRPSPQQRQTRDGLNAAPTSSFRNAATPKLSHLYAERNEWLKQDSPRKQEEPRVHMEGHGNSMPEPDTPLSAMGRMFRRMSRRSDMKSMKIATEATKDEKTFGEAVTHVCQVALVPEVYADDMEGEGNLGFYRPVRSAPPRRTRAPSTQQRVLDSVSKWKKENDQLKKKVEALRGHVEKLEQDLTTRDLEVAVWKLRVQELEEELREFKAKDGDNSTVEQDESVHQEREGDSESGIDFEWKEPQDVASSTKEEVLIDTTFVPKKITFDPLKASEDEEVEPPKEARREDNDDGDAEKDVAQEPVDKETEPMTHEVKEDVLIDTNIAPEPVIFDPLQGSGKDEDVVEDSILELITSSGRM